MYTGKWLVLNYSGFASLVLVCLSNFVYPVSLLLIRTIVHYHVSSKIDIESFRDALHGLSYWGESTKEKILAGYVARTGEKREHIVF